MSNVYEPLYSAQTENGFKIVYGKQVNATVKPESMAVQTNSGSTILQNLPVSSVNLNTTRSSYPPASLPPMMPFYLPPIHPAYSHVYTYAHPPPPPPITFIYQSQQDNKKYHCKCRKHRHYHHHHEECCQAELDCDSDCCCSHTHREHHHHHHHYQHHDDHINVSPLSKERERTYIPRLIKKDEYVNPSVYLRKYEHYEDDDLRFYDELQRRHEQEQPHFKQYMNESNVKPQLQQTKVSQPKQSNYNIRRQQLIEQQKVLKNAKQSKPPQFSQANQSLYQQRRQQQSQQRKSLQNLKAPKKNKKKT
jgi:hypothetical protein